LHSAVFYWSGRQRADNLPAQQGDALGNGHAFTWMELFAKLVIITFGFVLGLDARYERAVRVGRLRLPLVSGHDLPYGFR